MEAILESASVKMTFVKSGTVSQSASVPNRQSQATQKLLRDELLHYRSKLALNMPNEKLLTGIDIATGFSISLVENIVTKC